MASYEQQAEVLSRLNAFSHRNTTNFNKRDNVLHEIQRHRENQSASIKFRKNILESQKRANYMNEYDRLRGAITSGLVRETSTKYVNERLGKLKELASQSIHGVKHDVFKPKEEHEKTDNERMAEVNRKLANNQRGNRVHNTMIVAPAGSSATVYA